MKVKELGLEVEVRGLKKAQNNGLEIKEKVSHTIEISRIFNGGIFLFFTFFSQKISTKKIEKMKKK